MDKKTLEALVEEVCQLGCEKVDAVIIELSQTPPPPQWAQLSAAERQALYKELSDIMVIYK